MGSPCLYLTKRKNLMHLSTLSNRVRCKFLDQIPKRMKRDVLWKCRHQNWPTSSFTWLENFCRHSIPGYSKYQYNSWLDEKPTTFAFAIQLQILKRNMSPIFDWSPCTLKKNPNYWSWPDLKKCCNFWLRSILSKDRRFNLTSSSYYDFFHTSTITITNTIFNMEYQFWLRPHHFGEFWIHVKYTWLYVAN